MSRFQEQQTVFTDADYLCAALKDMGFNPTQHETPMHLVGYHGDRRAEVANIVIPRCQIGSASNDIGFVKVDGRYNAIISEYDQRQGKNATWLGQLAQKYKEHSCMATAKAKGYRFLGREIVQTAKGATVQLRFGVQ